MASSTTRRVATRFHDRTATLIYRDPERDLFWGWFGRDAPPRMHLMLISASPYESGVVWLEDHGRRTISSTGVPREITRGLFPWVWANRESIEQRWLRFMAMKKWLTVRIDDDQLVLVCYGGLPTEFTRPIGTPVWREREWPSSPPVRR